MLSDRAKQYLKTLDRRSVPINKNEVAEFFRSDELPTPDAILTFQETFGGYTFHAGLEPVVATILFPRANFLRDHPWTAPDVTKMEEHFFYRCFDTLYQCEFHLDSNGTYYEDWDPVHENFGYLIESKALLSSLSTTGDWEDVLDAHQRFCEPSTFRTKGLQRENIVSCGITTWWHNEDTVVQWRPDDIRAWTRK
ncbi:MAG: hypothetical protein COA78_24505 [Blastopirellula sp.]|nr:MAG: hypothetical protein COA78_24505 [Blastopirellula sp.]